MHFVCTVHSLPLRLLLLSAHYVAGMEKACQPPIHAARAVHQKSKRKNKNKMRESERHKRREGEREIADAQSRGL